MIVTARTPEDYDVCRAFLKERGERAPEHMEWRVLAQTNDENRIVALVMFDCFVRRTCYIHLEGFDGNDKRWFTPQLITAVFKYLFHDVGVIEVFGPIDERDERLLRIAKYLGFEELHRVKDGWYEGVDLVMTRMRKEQCRWLED